MKLAKPPVPTDDARNAIERENYMNHCRNIARIISSVEKDPQEAIDVYLTASNAEMEP
jgi:hypothetical protein